MVAHGVSRGYEDTRLPQAPAGATEISPTLSTWPRSEDSEECSGIRWGSFPKLKMRRGAKAKKAGKQKGKITKQSHQVLSFQYGLTSWLIEKGWVSRQSISKMSFRAHSVSLRVPRGEAPKLREESAFPRAY